jgi:transposase
MNQQTIDLFTLALGLHQPWYCTKVEFSAKIGKLDIWVDFVRGARFSCPTCDATGCSVHDTTNKEWRHLNFFQHECYLHARVPRVRCEDCGVHLVPVPWARPGSGFTLLFEAMVMTLAESLPMSDVSRTVTEFDTKLWRIVKTYVADARATQSYAAVERVGIDETARARGHAYVSVFVDLDTRRVLFATPGKDQSTISAFCEDLAAHGGAASAITDVSMDMSPAFIAGVETALPQAEITFDRFHVMKLAGEAVDSVRRDEQKTVKELKQSRYVWLKNPENLKPKERATFDNLSKQKLKTVRAYNLRMSLRDFWDQTPEDAGRYLTRWYRWALRSRLAPMVRLARTIHRHWHGILRYATSKLNNGVVEGINSKIQLARTRARGYRSVRNYIAMIYLVAGKLEFDLPT